MRFRQNNVHKQPFIVENIIVISVLLVSGKTPKIDNRIPNNKIYITYLE